MKEFNLSAEVTISLYTVVEAESLKEAIELAQGRDIESYKWGNNQQKYESWISSEYDGEVYNIHQD